MPPGRTGEFQPTPVFRETRRSRLVKLTLRNARGELLDIMVRNVSARGLNAAARGEPPQPNEVITVHLPDGGEHWGIVRWVDGNLFGVEFDVTAGDGGDRSPLPRSALDTGPTE